MGDIQRRMSSLDGPSLSCFGFLVAWRAVGGAKVVGSTCCCCWWIWRATTNDARSPAGATKAPTFEASTNSESILNTVRIVMASLSSISLMSRSCNDARYDGIWETSRKKCHDKLWSIKAPSIKSPQSLDNCQCMLLHAARRLALEIAYPWVSITKRRDWILQCYWHLQDCSRAFQMTLSTCGVRAPYQYSSNRRHRWHFTATTFPRACLALYETVCKIQMERVVYYWRWMSWWRIVKKMSSVRTNYWCWRSMWPQTATGMPFGR